MVKNDGGVTTSSAAGTERRTPLVAFKCIHYYPRLGDQVAKLDRGHTYLPNFPGAPRRALPLKPVQKAQKFPALRAGALQIMQKG